MATQEILNGKIESFKELTQAINRYKDAMATAKEGTQEWTDAADELRAAQEKKDKILKAQKGTLDQYNASSQNSINVLKEQIKQENTLRNSLDMTSEEYKQSTERLNELNTKLREAGVAAGDMRANVGNYAGSLKPLFDDLKDSLGDALSKTANSVSSSFSQLGVSMQGATTASQGLEAGFQLLSKNPIGAIVTAISAAIGALTRGIQSSEENTNKFRQAIAPLEALMVLFDRAVQQAASKVLDFVNNIRSNEKVTNTFKTVLQAITTAFNVLKTHIGNVVTILTKLWNAMKPVRDVLKDVGTFIMNTVVKGIDLVIKGINVLAKSKIGQKLGLNELPLVTEAWKEAGEAVDEFTDSVKDAEEELENINDKEAALQKARRSLMVANAKLQGEVAQKELEIAEARNAEEKDYDNIIKLINEKTELNRKIAENNVAIKAKELAIIRQRNALADSNTKDLDAEAQAMVALVDAQNALTRAEAAGAKEQKEILSGRIAEENKKRTEARTKAVNELSAALKELDTQYQETVNKLNETPLSAPEGSGVTTDSITTYYDEMKALYRADYDAYSAMTEAKISELEKFISAQKALGNDTAAQEAEIAKLRAANTKQYNKMTASQIKAEESKNKTIKALNTQQLSNFSNLMDSMSGLFEENTLAYKATATAKALIDTYVAANAALAETPGGAVARAVAMAATIAAGIANVMAIWKTDVENPSVSTSTSTPTTTPQAADETPYTFTRTIQTVDEEEKLNQPIYVSVTDINNMQNKVQVVDQESSW